MTVRCLGSRRYKLCATSKEPPLIFVEMLRNAPENLVKFREIVAKFHQNRRVMQALVNPKKCNSWMTTFGGSSPRKQDSTLSSRARQSHSQTMLPDALVDRDTRGQSHKASRIDPAVPGHCCFARAVSGIAH
jgi:hypothetical protein